MKLDGVAGRGQNLQDGHCLGIIIIQYKHKQSGLDLRLTNCFLSICPVFRELKAKLSKRKKTLLVLSTPLVTPCRNECGSKQFSAPFMLVVRFAGHHGLWSV